jgi:AcrR family transcriptional regulator
VPKIATSTLAQHRDWRRSQLIEAATAIALESGGQSISVAAVAARAGLSRTSVYEYFASSSDLVADLIVEELDAFARTLTAAVGRESDPAKAISAWIAASLEYIADGRHLLAKALNAVDLPQSRAPQIGAAHRALLAPLRKTMADFGIGDIDLALSLIHSATDSASRRIENGGDAATIIAATTAFSIAGLAALKS